MSQKLTDLKNHLVEKLDAPMEEMKSVKLDDVKDSLEKYGRQILEDPKYFFIPALIGILLTLLVISVFLLLEEFNNEATAHLERRLQNFSKDTQDAFGSMLGKFKEEILKEFGEQYGCGPHKKFKKIAITFILLGFLLGVASFYTVLKCGY